LGKFGVIHSTIAIMRVLAGSKAGLNAETIAHTQTETPASTRHEPAA
jgi:hypothetical protein